tara:strand:- start:80 stop:451 length:372 start_codon:yes stop_codon:yes gene_type:complete
MATKLEKDITRESTVLRDERNVNVTLGADQSVKLKLKGMKSGEVKIDIGELYNQLAGVEDDSAPVQTSVTYHRKETGKYVQPDPKVAKTVLNDLRSQNAISSLDIETLVKFDMIIVNLLNSYK